MPRSLLFLSGLVSLVLGMLLQVAPVSADDPPATRVLVSQRVELLPQGPLCWKVLRTSLPAGMRVPQTGYVAEPLGLGYSVEGQHRIDYAGGPSVVAGSGSGVFIGNNNWHAHVNTGTTPVTDLVFALSCGPDPRAGTPGITPLGTTGALPGIRLGQVPHVVQLLEVSGAPGSGTPTQSAAGPLTAYFLEGTVEVSTPAGAGQYKPGDLLVIPPGTAFQTRTVGSVPAKALVVMLVPVGEPAQRLMPEVRLPGGTPSALPRTGGALGWAGPAVMLLGAVLLAAGTGLRRVRSRR